MPKTLFILLLFPFVGCSQGQKLLVQDYSFIHTDGEMTKLHQSNDTLYELKCYTDQPCQPVPKAHYKILSFSRTEEFVVLKLEGLDTLLLTINPYPATRYSLLAIKTMDNKQLGYLPLALGLIKQQLDTVQTDFKSLKEKFFFTFFSDTYLKELSSLKKVMTKEEAQEIIESTKQSDYKTLIEKYSKTETQDVYASGLSAEILNRACIEKGFNPFGAGPAINTFMRQ